MLHQVPAGIVGNDGMRHALVKEFEGRNVRALVSGRVSSTHTWTGCRHRERRKWGRGGAVVDTGQPAGVAVSEDVDGFALLFLADALDNLRPCSPMAGSVLCFLRLWHWLFAEPVAPFPLSLLRVRW